MLGGDSTPAGGRPPSSECPRLSRSCTCCPTESWRWPESSPPSWPWRTVGGTIAQASTKDASSKLIVLAPNGSDISTFRRSKNDSCRVCEPVGQTTRHYIPATPQCQHRPTSQPDIAATPRCRAPRNSDVRPVAAAKPAAAGWHASREWHRWSGEVFLVPQAARRRDLVADIREPEQPDADRKRAQTHAGTGVATGVKSSRPAAAARGKLAPSRGHCGPVSWRGMSRSPPLVLSV